jgi:4-hydroxy-tetrahydrodipicolinate reductase
MGGEMKIGIVGTGRMGTAVENVCREMKLNVVAKFNRVTPLDHQNAQGMDVLIDFTSGETAQKNIECALDQGINIVSGTTGWDTNWLLTLKQKRDLKAAVLHSPNFSLGLNIFLQLIDRAATLVNMLDFDAFVEEFHHDQKMDAPSGTAKKIEKILMARLPQKKEALYHNPEGKISPEQLQILSVRSKSIPGIHKVTFQSHRECVKLSHSAFDRSVFAEGAVRVALWLKGKTGFYTMEDYLADLI